MFQFIVESVFRKNIIRMALIAFCMSSSVAPVMASEIVSTKEHHQFVLNEDAKSEMVAMLSEQDVKQKLINYGISPEQAQERISNLTAHELQTLSAHFEDMPAAGSELTVLLLVLIIFLLFQMN